MIQGLPMILHVFVSVALLAIACTSSSRPTPSPSGSDPLATVRDLLRLHDLLGKQPEERSDKTRNTKVKRSALNPLFTDLEDPGPFLSDLYVGFVVGALARNQGRLFVSRQGGRAEVTAGKARIVLKLAGNRFRIVLSESIPEDIKKRAAQEKIRFDKAGKQKQ